MEAPKLFHESPTVEIAYGRKLMGLTPVQHVAVRHLAAGWTIPQVALELRLPAGIIRKWSKENASFRAAFEAQVVAHTEMVETILLEGERQAAHTLVEALAANNRDGKPNWQARVIAATTLLDRAGTRGKAVDRAQVAQVTAHVDATSPGVEAALQKALRDPGVRLWLKESGAVVGLLAAAPPNEVPGEIIAIDDGFDIPPNPIDNLEESA